MGIRFEKVIEKARFRSPLQGMEEVEVLIERRRDPLLGHWAIGSPGLKGKQAVFFGPTDEQLLEKAAAESRERCFFCPERVQEMTPRYPEDCLPGGCLREGECFLFPNLFPIGAVHAVVALGEAHYRNLDDFPAELLEEGLRVAARFVRAAHEHEPEAGYFTINANYLFPAGASVIHPHLQILGGRHPVTEVERLIEACSLFGREHGAGFFEQLLIEERGRGERWVGACGPVQWLSPFAPRGINEVLGILPGCANLSALDEDAIGGLAEGLCRVLGYYHQIGFSTFNFSVLSASLADPDPPFDVFVRVISRQNVYENYRADDYFIQKLLGEELMVIPPEDVAEGLRAIWR